MRSLQKNATAHFGVFDNFTAASRCHADVRRVQAGNNQGGHGQCVQGCAVWRKGICQAADHGR
ncbi:hypothetical protein CK623_10020 [Vandammella animalimorsus]|uniref:Uncharacterized protein n=2 Tax=Vandammella animalimorsus TaxID=2029117 RepID=A0A2A2ALJ1_9BURK|nr:hypothetical protein CK623_10020 [Vandammella animalimorsus]RMX10850.1 hypothetical protein EBQ34_11490 [Vandammella animalimorsus]